MYWGGTVTSPYAFLRTGQLIWLAFSVDADAIYDLFLCIRKTLYYLLQRILFSWAQFYILSTSSVPSQWWAQLGTFLLFYLALVFFVQEPMAYCVCAIIFSVQEPMASSEHAAKQLHVLFGDLDKSRSVEMPRRLLFLTENTADTFLPRFLQRLETSLDLTGQASTGTVTKCRYIFFFILTISLQSEQHFWALVKTQNCQQPHYIYIVILRSVRTVIFLDVAVPYQVLIMVTYFHSSSSPGCAPWRPPTRPSMTA